MTALALLSTDNTAAIVPLVSEDGTVAWLPVASGDNTVASVQQVLGSTRSYCEWQGQMQDGGQTRGSWVCSSQCRLGVLHKAAHRLKGRKQWRQAVADSVLGVAPTTQGRPQAVAHSVTGVAPTTQGRPQASQNYNELLQWHVGLDWHLAGLRK